MGAWSSLELAPATLTGLAKTDFPPKTKEGDLDEEITAQAKETVEDLVASRIPSYVAESGGAEAFFDSAVGVSALAGVLQRMIGLAYLYHLWSDQGSRPGRGTGYTEKAREVLNPSGFGGQPTGRLILAVKGFAGQAPVLMDLATEAGGTAPVVAVIEPHARTPNFTDEDHDNYRDRPFAISIT